MAKKNNCRSWRSPSPLYHTPCSEKLVEHKRWAYDDDHKQIIVITDVEDVYAYIQSFKEETGVYNVIRLLQARDEGLERLDASHGQGFYGDVSNVPDNIHDLHEFGEHSNDMLDQYNKLLGTSYTPEQLMAAFADGTLADLIKAKTAEAEEPVKEGEE